jgi:hypothetical protein
LARSHGPADRAAAGEQIFARLLTCGHEAVVDGLSRPVRQIEHGELSDAQGLLVEAHESDLSVASEVTQGRVREALQLGCRNL